MNYSEKLKDPRWQKKRLEIFKRDNWACQKCGDNESTLNVHHKIYFQGCDPWDYHEDVLTTLCVDCHEFEREAIPQYTKTLTNALKVKFLADDICTISDGFLGLELVHAAEVVASMLKWVLVNKNLQKELLERYFNTLSEKAKNGKSSS